MKKLFILILSIIMLFTFTSCGIFVGNGGSGSTGELQVGIVLPAKEEPRWLQDQKSFEKSLGDSGFTSEVLFSQGSSRTELKNVEKLIGKGIKVLVICAHDADAAEDAVEMAKNAGVKVVCYDRLITGTDAVDYYVTFNSFCVGVEQGQYLIDKYKGEKNIPLYLYSGATTDNNAFIFFSGAWSVLSSAVKDGQFKLANCDKIANYIGKEFDPERDHDILSKIMKTISTDWDFNKAKVLAEANLAANKKEAKGDVAILAPNDGTARAIADVFMAADGVNSYIVTGQDAELASLKYIQEDKQSMTIWKNTEVLAAATCSMVTQLLSDEEPGTDAEYDNLKKMVPSIEEDVVVLDKGNLRKEIENGSFDQKDIDQAK